MDQLSGHVTKIDRTPEAFKQTLFDNLYYTRGQAVYTASPHDIYMSVAHAIRDYMMYNWQKNVDTYWKQNPKFVYYLSAEYLMGQQLSQNLLYTGMTEIVRQALSEYNISLDDILKLDIEPGLGNGGLGRLAACFMDSLATLDIPALGYGIRYEFGIFRQSFRDGWQVESPDEWLTYGNPWEFAQPDDMVEVQFGGYTERYHDDQGRLRVRWIGTQKVMGEPYHTLVPGYETKTINMLRLWRARATKEFDFQLFDVGDYAQAVAQKTSSENISKVLYPNDNTLQGKELRLKQQYFFVACSLQDIFRRFKLKNSDWDTFPDIVAIQLNDTHPVIAIPELMRMLVDDYGVDWDRAWNITTRTFAATQHTLLPEALEKWSVGMFEWLLPRHLEIIYEINHRFLIEVRTRFPGDEERVRRMSIIEEGQEKQIRMAYLACVGSHSINGVAELQSMLLKERVLHDFYTMFPERFNNKTNGVTPRRFMKIANPGLADLITSKIGGGWLKDLDQLTKLEPLAGDAQFRRAWQQVKQQNKERLAGRIHSQLEIQVNPDSLFDVMVKRLHEYKRQLLKVLHIITLYNRHKDNPGLALVPRTFIFGAKAAPGYHAAKLIIKLINSVAQVVNHTASLNDSMKVVYVPNFNVTWGEIIYPAANVSEQISLAGKEASGTGNMKFALNGALTVGTLDGANIEIREHVGAENFFLFGLTTEQVFALKENGYRPVDYYQRHPELRRAIDLIASGYFSNGDQSVFRPLIDSLLYHDEYLLLADYPSYIEAQDQVEGVYRDQERWAKMSILNTARSGFFSSDRSMRQYCEEIWHVKPLKFED
ncbi:MAG: glycogen/starch/alpha-glucan phosphorylase [Anaerolinea sp.]|nr:glycogen/starch/alpha-glucan phosphorylase [Anaerolinea sp.]MCC6972944.1 glycogen/starch/alpha-glucan phosphorylase [Anaerolineae bacterium]CAG0967615.1 glycogen phosphorylase [Anaerolineae bacterium]